jgi:hypothetical protein
MVGKIDIIKMYTKMKKLNVLDVFNLGILIVITDYTFVTNFICICFNIYRFINHLPPFINSKCRNVIVFCMNSYIILIYTQL